MNICTVICGVIFLGVLSTLIIDIGFPDLIAHPYSCNVSVISINKSFCDGKTIFSNRFSCYELHLSIAVNIKNDVDTQTQVLKCKQTEIECINYYNDTIIPCVYDVDEYDLSKYNSTNLFLIFILLLILIPTTAYSTGIIYDNFNKSKLLGFV